MWSYYGAKTNIVDLYPKPRYKKVIEPFAGSARYALKYFENDVLLVDKYEVVIKIWKWLQLCSPEDILRLPRKIEIGQTLDNFTFDCEEAVLLMGFMIKGGAERPTKKPTTRKVIQRPNFLNYSIKRIAANLFKIKHWEIVHGSYLDIFNEECTWFIDPPYQQGGQSYVCSNKNINFGELATWCKSRKGQSIVCETATAKWLPFELLTTQRGTTGKQREGIWVNDIMGFNNQLKMF